MIANSSPFTCRKTGPFRFIEEIHMKYLPILLLTINPDVFAQSEDNYLERITVSSDFRSSSIDKISASVSVISDLNIQQRQAQHLEEILAVGANINFASGASRGKFIQIRGIGERSQFAEPINPSVGFILDDFDFSGLVGIGTLFDVEQVEILRGPQATEFGAAGMAGTIKIKTADADDNQQTKFATSIGQNNSWSLATAFGDKITDKLFYRFAINQYKSDGFVENIYLNQKDTDNLDELSARVKLKYKHSDSLIFDMNYQYFDIDNGYDAFSLDNDRKTRSDRPGFDTQKTHALGFKVSSELKWADVVSAVNYSTSDLAYGYDEDWTYVGFHPYEYSSVDYYFREKDIASVDIRVLSNKESQILGGTTDWLLGFFAKDSTESLVRQYTFADAEFSSTYKPTNLGIYAQTDSQLTKTLSLLAGLRLDSFKTDYADSNLFYQDTHNTLVGGKVALEYNSGPATVYTSISRGYKAGGFNPDERVSSDRRIFNPEYNWNYEIGVKGYSVENDASVRLAIFYMQREDTQVSDFDVLLREDGTADFIDIIGNANTGTNMGLEVEASWQLSDAISLFASYGYLDATFENYQLADGTMVERQQQAQAPKHTFHIASDIIISDSINWHLGIDGKDEYRFSDGHEVTSPFTLLVNTQVQFALEFWTLELWAKNLLDREYYVRGFGGFSNDPRDEYAFAEPYFQLGDGRQIGISVNYRY